MAATLYSCRHTLVHLEVSPRTEHRSRSKIGVFTSGLIFKQYAHYVNLDILIIITNT